MFSLGVCPSFLVLLEQNTLVAVVLDSIRGFASEHPVWMVIGSVYLSLLLVCLLSLLIRPIWLLRANEALGLYSVWQLPTWLGSVQVPIGHILLVGYFHYHPRVLDAWVAQYIGTVRQVFANEPTVRARGSHIDLPVLIDGTPTVAGPGSLQGTFDRNVAGFLIRGEGGSGKTSLACQLAKWAMSEDAQLRLIRHHPMIPVLLESDFDSFLAAVGSKLRLVADIQEDIPEELLIKLLRRKRLLVIVDRFSELSEGTRQCLKPGAKGFSANALVVTSRLNEDFGGRPYTILEPLRIEGDYISDFLSAYLKLRQKRTLFPDSEYFPMLGRLSTMVGDRDITVMLVKLYAELMIAVKEGSTADLPESIPNLMQEYLSFLNSGATKDVLSNRTVHQIVRPLAWACVRQNFYPESIGYAEALAAVASGGAGDSEIEYLETKLQIIQCVGPAQDRLRFTLDPLAEYLAALYLVEELAENEDEWDSFLARVDESTKPEGAIAGFLLALRDCCMRKQYQGIVPEHVAAELARRSGVDLESLDSTRVSQRVQRLVANLYLPEPEDRKAAAEALGSIGHQAYSAAGILARVAKDEDAEVRAAAVMALGYIGAVEAVPVISEALGDANSQVRWSAAVALHSLHPNAKDAISALVKAVQDPDSTVRKWVIRAIWMNDPESPVAIEALIRAIREKKIDVRRYGNWYLEAIRPVPKASIQLLVGSLRDENVGVRLFAVELLGKIGPEASLSKDALFEALKDANMPVRRAALNSVAKVCPMDIAIEAYLVGLRDEHEDIRSESINALAERGEDAEIAIDSLLIVARDKDAVVRSRACSALGIIAPVEARVINVQLTALSDPSYEVRLNAADALGKAPACEQVIHGLMSALSDHSESVCATAALSLAGMGSAAAQAGKVLIELLKTTYIEDEGRSPRKEIINALKRVDSDAEQKLIQALRGERESAVRLSLISALGDFGLDGLGVLVDLIQNREEPTVVRTRAIWSLGSRKERAQDLLDLFMCLVTHKAEKEEVRRAALYSLSEKALSEPAPLMRLVQIVLDEGDNPVIRECVAGELRFSGALLKPVAKQLLTILKNSTEPLGLKSEVASILSGVGPDIEEVNQFFLDALRTRRYYSIAIRAAGNMGSAGKEAVDDLILALRDEDSYVRRAAAEALGRIGSSDSISALMDARITRDQHLSRACAEAIRLISPEVDVQPINLNWLAAKGMVSKTCG